MKLKRLLRRIDSQLIFWQDICAKYPLSEAYKKIVFDLQQQRANESSKIGLREGGK
jgi:hypothetical protein